MRSRWIGIVFTLLFLIFLIAVARRIAAPLLDFHLFPLETKLIYIILASVTIGGLLMFLLVLYFPPWTSKDKPIESTSGAPIRRRISEAQTALQLGDSQRGMELLEKVQHHEADYWYARKLIGDLLTERGEWSNAANEYREALKHASGEDRALMLLSIGIVYEAQDEVDQAKDLYRQAIQLAPESREVLIRLRALAIRNQDWQEAMNWQEKIEQDFVDGESEQEINWSIGIRYELARQSSRSGSFKTAQALLKYIFRMTDYFTPAYLLQGEIHEQQQNSLAGFRIYDQGFRMTQNPALLKKIAESLLIQNLPAKAVEFLREVVRNNSGDPRVAFCLGDLYRKLEMNEDAIRTFEGIRRKHPDWLLNNSTLAGLYYRAGRNENALQIYKAIAEGSEELSSQPWQCYNCNTTYTEYAGFCMVCTMWNSINLNQNKAGTSDFGYEKSTALPL
jgi:tetratricopeptide (TPR) repeat protein